MAAPAKKREIDETTKDSEDEPISSDDNDDDEMDDEQQGMEIQVDFEGRNPQDPDFHGIKTLLQQLFLKAHIDLSMLTDIIISQNYVGSVVKQSEDADMSDDDEHDINDVYGITTVINVSAKQENPCVAQLRELLRQLASEHGNDATNDIVKTVLENDTLGLLINERFVNIPAQISVPLLENLISEMERATRKGMPFKFDYYVMICKLYKFANSDNGKKRKGKKTKSTNEETEILWSNPEEEVLAENSYCSFEFSVEKDTDSGLSGSWTEDDAEMMPYRRVLILEASKLRSILDEIRRLVS